MHYGSLLFAGTVRPVRSLLPVVCISISLVFYLCGALALRFYFKLPHVLGALSVRLQFVRAMGMGQGMA